MRNPYIVDRPLDDQDLFIGRGAILDGIQQGLAEDERLFLLYGKPRIGKTSLLNQLGLRLGNAYDVVLLPWTGLRGEAPLWRLIEAMAQASGQTPPDHASVIAAQEGQYEGLTHNTAAVSNLLRGLAGPSGGPLRLYCFDAVPLVELADASAWRRALRALQAALAPDLGIGVVVALQARPVQVNLALPGVRQFTVDRFTARETEDLLMIAVRGDMTYDLDATAQIHRFAGGEPHFVQMFGRVLFEQRLRRGWVDVPEVSHAAETVMALGVPEFEEQWERASWAARIVLAVFGERVGTDGVATTEEIGLYLSQLRVDVPPPDVQAALDELVQRDVLEVLGGHAYRLVNSLFLRWVKREHGTLDTVRSSHKYHQRREEPTSGWATRHIDVWGVVLWVAVIALALSVVYVWRSRQRVVTWTAAPTPVPTQPVSQTPTVVSTSERGVAPGRIIYMAKPTPQDKWAIYAMHSDGSDPEKLTNGATNDTSPAWSADGRRVLFVSDRDGNREVYVMSADGSSQRNLTRNPAEDWTPCWSPDGQQVAFASFRDANWEIYVMGADGANPKRLTRSPSADYAPAWSPDGQRIAFVSDRSGNLDIWTMAVDGSDVRQFTADGTTDQSPAWSPDGQLLAWESYRTGNMEIYAANADGSEPRNLSQDAYADDHGVTWAPSGQSIAYYTNRNGGWDIMTLNLVSGQRTNITQSDDIEQSPHWGP